MRYTLGLDIGIASVGYAVLADDDNGIPYKIERLGVRIFDKAEQDKTGESLAKPRREARGQRRRLRRKKHRKDRIRSLISAKGIMSAEEMTALFASSDFEKSVYELRVDGLDRVLNREELVRLLIHYAQRRGYNSTSKAEETAESKESGPVKRAISENQACMEKYSYRTVGEMLWRDSKFRSSTGELLIHNRPDDYKCMLTRADIDYEVKTILERQIALGSRWLDSDFIERYRTILLGQRSFDEGPGEGSPFGGDQIANMLGKCSLEPEEDRAVKASYTFEYFRLLQDINHMRITSEGVLPRDLTPEERTIVIAKAMASHNVKYADLRKALHMSEDCRFNNLYYGDKAIAEQEKKSFGQMQSYHKLRKAMDGVEKGTWEALSIEMRDTIAYILTVYKSDARRIKELKNAGIPEKFNDALLPLSFTKTGNLSIKAMQKLIPYLKQGLTYDKAVAQAYPEKQGSVGVLKKTLSVSDLDESIRNPVVFRAVTQTIKVINAVVRTYGSPERVRIELAREMGKSFTERGKIQKRQVENQKSNEKVCEEIRKYKHAKPTGQDIVKYKLWQEQDGDSPYSGKHLELERLFEPGYAQVDHIIPYSISLDDGYNNKVVVFSEENQNKRDRLPYEWFGGDTERWHAFEVRAGLLKNAKKRSNLLLKELPEEKRSEFKQRNLVDTQYLSREIYRLLDSHLKLADTAQKKAIQVVNGAITAQMRKRIGIEKIRENGDKHHAADAAIIACVNSTMVERITKYAQYCERYRSTKVGFVDAFTGEVVALPDFEPNFPKPWPRFYDEMKARLSDHPAEEIARLHLQTYSADESIPLLFVSRMPNHKVTGALHMETVYRGKPDQEYILSKVPLADLKIDKKATEWEDKIISGNNRKYYNPESDVLLYNALLTRLQEFDGDGKKAFTEPFHKPKADGTPGPIVNKVRMIEKSTLNFNVRGGVAKNDRMVRVDLFYVPEDGYYIVPVYVADIQTDKLPNMAILANKHYTQWKEMQDQDFLFSVYPGDLLFVENEKGINFTANKGSSLEPAVVREKGYFYFRSCNIHTASIAVDFPDRSYSAEGIGVKRCTRIEKYQVDVLGNVARVKTPERRARMR